MNAPFRFKEIEQTQKPKLFDVLKSDMQNEMNALFRFKEVEVKPRLFDVLD
jgi:hypothetical protein